MCHQVQCDICGKPTWEGCGKHIEQALADVPVAERCQGHSDEEITQYQAAQTPAQRSEQGSASEAERGSRRAAFKRLFARQ